MTGAVAKLENSYEKYPLGRLVSQVFLCYTFVIV